MKRTHYRSVRSGDLALDLGLDVQRRLAEALAPLVARDHEVANLAAQLGIDHRRRQPRELLVDVERRLAAACAAGVAGLEHLADLVVALVAGKRGAGSRSARGIAVQRQAAFAVVLPSLAARYKRRKRGDCTEDADDPKDCAERVLHGLSVAHARGRSRFSQAADCCGRLLVAGAAVWGTLYYVD